MTDTTDEDEANPEGTDAENVDNGGQTDSYNEFEDQVNSLNSFEVKHGRLSFESTTTNSYIS